MFEQAATQWAVAGVAGPLRLSEAYTPLGARLERAAQLVPDSVLLLGGGEPFASDDVPSRLVRLQEAQDDRAAQVVAPRTPSTHSSPRTPFHLRPLSFGLHPPPPPPHPQMRRALFERERADLACRAPPTTTHLAGHGTALAQARHALATP